MVSDMNKNKLITIILSILIIIGLVFAIFIFTGSKESVNNNLGNKPEILFYGSDSCMTCKQVKTLLSKYTNIYVNHKRIEEEKNYRELQTVTNYFKQEAVVPTILVGNKIISGEDILKNFDGVLNNEIKEGYQLFDISKIKADITSINEEEYKKMNLFVIALAGLVDGINPCAMSMLILLISIVTKINRRSIIYVGAAFAAGTFLTYFFIGLNIFKVMEIASKISWLIIVIYLATIFLSSFIIYLNTKDFINIRKGKIENIKNQLSSNQKSKIHKYLNKLTNSRNIIFYGLILGIILTLLEFTCTGQVYVPTLSYMISSGKGIVPYLYLFVYNFMFIVPLIIVCVISYINKSTNKIMNLLYSKLSYIKMITNIVYVIIIIILVIRLTKLI